MNCKFDELGCEFDELDKLSSNLDYLDKLRMSWIS